MYTPEAITNVGRGGWLGRLVWYIVTIMVENYSETRVTRIMRNSWKERISLLPAADAMTASRYYTDEFMIDNCIHANDVLVIDEHLLPTLLSFLYFRNFIHLTFQPIKILTLRI